MVSTHHRSLTWYRNPPCIRPLISLTLNVNISATRKKKKKRVPSLERYGLDRSNGGIHLHYSLLVVEIFTFKVSEMSGLVYGVVL